MDLKACIPVIHSADLKKSFMNKKAFSFFNRRLYEVCLQGRKI